jgi:hypothetical protein
MSELRVALVAEGPTDAIVIQAALRALLPRPFVLTQLQPEPIRPKLGAGWGGVLRWCFDFATRGHARIEDDPTLPGFDLFVIHIDADVAEKRYDDVGDVTAELARQRGWPALPNVIQCPPPSGSADAMRSCLLAWAGMQTPGPTTVLCVPSKAIEAWLTAATFADGHALQNQLECNRNVEAELRALPLAQRIKKNSRDYRARERTIAEAWSVVRQRCTQAERFSTEVAAVSLTGRTLQES